MSQSLRISSMVRWGASSSASEEEAEEEAELRSERMSGSMVCAQPRYATTLLFFYYFNSIFNLTKKTKNLIYF